MTAHERRWHLAAYALVQRDLDEALWGWPEPAADRARMETTEQCEAFLPHTDPAFCRCSWRLVYMDCMYDTASILQSSRVPLCLPTLR